MWNVLLPVMMLHDFHRMHAYLIDISTVSKYKGLLWIHIFVVCFCSVFWTFYLIFGMLQLRFFVVCFVNSVVQFFIIITALIY